MWAFLLLRHPLSSTNSTSKRKHTGSMRQLGQKKRQKSNLKSDGELETPSSYEAG
jgi:putative transposase